MAERSALMSVTVRITDDAGKIQIADFDSSRPGFILNCTGEGFKHDDFDAVVAILNEARKHRNMFDAELLSKETR